MKIIFCLHHFLPDFVAGTEVYTFNLAKNLQSQGIEVAVLIPGFDKTSIEEYQYENIRVIKYPENSIEDRAMILGKRKPDGLKEFIRVLKIEKPTIVHFHELAPGRGTNIFHVEATHLLNIRIVMTFHLSHYSCYTGNLFYKEKEYCDGKIDITKCSQCAYYSRNITGIKGKILNNISSIFYKLKINTLEWNNAIGTAIGFPFLIQNIRNDLIKISDLSNRIVVLTKWYQTILEKNGIESEKIIYIPQGLTGNNTVQSFQNPPLSLPLKLIFIGRISVYKGVHLLIQALKQFSPSEVSLDIYGPHTDNEYANNCKKDTIDMENIQWKGSIDSSDVINRMTQYHILCLPSTFSEMSPLVIQEAYAAGIPVLASDVYGNVEQIKDNVNGWLFRYNDSISLAKKIKMLIKEPDLVNMARLNLPKITSFKTVAEKYFEIYNEIVNE